MNSKLDMKKVVIWVFGIMIISFLIAGSIIATQGIGNGIFFTRHDKNYNVNVEKAFSVEGIKEISANTVSTDISFIPVDSSDIKVHFYGYSRTNSTRPAPELYAELKGDKLEIEIKHKLNFTIGFNFGSERLKLDVYVPKSYTGDMKVNTVSGDLTAENLTPALFSYHSTSGDLAATSLKTKDVDVDTVSGDVLLRDFFGNIDSNSVSGNIRADFAAYENNTIKINTTSGDASLRLNENANFNMTFNTVSGDFETNYEMNRQNASRRMKNFQGRVGDGTGQITYNSTSGDLTINK